MINSPYPTLLVHVGQSRIHVVSFVLTVSKSLAAEEQETQSLCTNYGVPWGSSPFISQQHSAFAQHQSSIDYLP